MSFDDEQDALWRKQLPADVYQALRRGIGEAPHTGAYEKTAVAGTYLCAGCGNPLFDSEQKVVDNSGYATFGVDEREGAVKFIRTYAENGAERTTAVCSRCRGTIGTVGSTVICRSEDLAQATPKRCVHAYSLSLRLRKAFTPRNHPFSYLLILGTVALGVAVGWYALEGTVSRTLELSHVSGEVRISIGDTQVQALFVHASDVSATGIPAGTQPTLVILEGAARQLRFAERVPVDLLWLDDTNTVIEGQVNVLPEMGDAVVVPTGARMVLVISNGTLPAELFARGVFVYLDATALVR